MKPGFFKHWIDDIKILRNIGEFFFEKNYFTGCLHDIQTNCGNNHNNELFEKMAIVISNRAILTKRLNITTKQNCSTRTNYGFLTVLAWCYRKKGKYEKAVGYYLEAEKLEPENLQVQAYLGHIYEWKPIMKRH